MSSNAASLPLFAPEIVLSAGVIVVLGVGLVFRATSRGLVLGLAVATLIGAALATALTSAAPGATPARGGGALFGGLVVRDGFADFFKLLFCGGGLLVALASVASREGVGESRGVGVGVGPDRDAAEYASLLLAAVLAAAVMAASADLLTAYLSLEFVSLLSYILAAFARRSQRSAEAGLKYAIYGGVATGAMLYGFSWLYGLAGSTDFGAVRAALASAPPLVAGTILALVLAGLGFKMALVPFHTWCPDVYEGAPTPVAAFFSIVPKAAGFALAYRLLVGAGALPLGAPEIVARSGHAMRLVTDSGPGSTTALVFAVAAAVTMTLGNLAAIAQRNMKRLLAYSSIAQAGNVAMALAVGSPTGARAMLVYLGVYLFMNLAAFLAVIALVQAGAGEALDDLRGLGRRAPILAFCLTVGLLSLAGLPPLAGFVAKFAMFSAVVERGTSGGGAPFYGLAAVGVLNTVVSIYYYARVAKVMYFDPPRAQDAAPIRIAPLHTGLLCLATAFVVALGIYVSPLLALVERSVNV